MGHKSNEVGEGGEGEKSIPLMPLKVDLIQEYISLPSRWISFKIVEQLIYVIAMQAAAKEKNDSCILVVGTTGTGKTSTVR